MSDPRPAPTPPTGSLPPRERVVGAGISWVSCWTLRWLVIAAGFVVVAWLVSQVWTILLPIVLALILTTVLQPAARLLEQRLGFGPALAAGAAVVGALGVVALTVLFIVPSVGSQVGDIADSASDGLSELQQRFADSDLVTQAQVDSVVSAAQDRLQSSASTIANGVLVGVSAVTSALVTTVLTLVLAFFFLKDGRRFLPWVAATAGPTAGHHLTEVASRAWVTLGGFVRTQALVGLIDAVLIGLGLVVLGIPLALPLAVLTFVAAFAPIVGAIAVGAIAVLVALVSDGYVAALIVLAIVLVVQQLEGNVLLPWLQGRTLNLHAGVVLLTVVLGSTLFGVAGAFLSVPAVAVAAVVLRYLNEVVTERTGPTEPAAAHTAAQPDPPPEDPQVTP
ncbi:MAG: AI-2E family transporter [Pimelobacter sp.]|nr:AI-2E family transporter [Pimelobacter sp.]